MRTDLDDLDYETSAAGLESLLGTEGFLRLVEARAGTRLYVPEDILRSGLVEEIGAEAAAKLSSAHAGDCIRVPLARALRVRHYQADGLSIAKIAVRLGLTETGVEKIVRRLRPVADVPDKPRKRRLVKAAGMS